MFKLSFQLSNQKVNDFHTIDRRTISYSKNADDLLRGEGSPSLIKYWFCHMFLSIFIFTIHMFLFIAHYVGLTSNVYLWASQECTSQKLVTDAYFCVNRNKLSPCHLLLKRACTFFFAQCTMKLKNMMHWKGQTKTLNAKRGSFFG